MDRLGKVQPIETSENKAFCWVGVKIINKLRKKRETKWKIRAGEERSHDFMEN